MAAGTFALDVKYTGQTVVKLTGGSLRIYRILNDGPDPIDLFIGVPGAKSQPFATLGAKCSIDTSTPEIFVRLATAAKTATGAYEYVP